MKRRPGKPALDLLEESMHLLRRASAGVLATYFIGALPFVLGLLYFWADMSRGAFAHEHVVEASFTITLLFIWMKYWQSVFCAKLRALAAGAEAPQWNFRRAARVLFMQAALQPLALFARPIAALITLPYGWTFAFFQNVLVLGDNRPVSIREVFHCSAAQAKLWPKENHLALAILTGFGLFIWVNVVTAMFVIPSLLKSLLGIETMFTRSMWSLANSTFFAASCAGAYLCVNPITQAFYVLRCFYGESLETGEDLRVDLRAVRVATRATVIAAMLFLSGFANVSAAPPASAPATSGAQLNERIDDVLSRREYAWRMPREVVPKTQKSWLTNFFEGAMKTVRHWLQPSKRWIKKLVDWIDHYMSHRQPSASTGSGRAWLKSLRWLFIGLASVTVCVLGFLIWKRWKVGRSGRAFAVAQAVAAMPDLTAENVTADQLPEDGWMRLAREMSERGELRLALRALYLAGLAHLGARELIVLARHKSNRDYERDLRRRARSRAEIVTSFSANVGAFERAWYGLHEVTLDTLAGVETNLERMRS